LATVAINGMGRIGRAVMKILIESGDFNLVALNDITAIENVVYLLKYDSVYGKYRKAVDHIFREEKESLRYREVVGTSEDPIVSSDIIQDARASIVDLTMIQVVDGDMVKVMSWYDNEWGYANQMARTCRAWLKEVFKDAMH